MFNDTGNLQPPSRLHWWLLRGSAAAIILAALAGFLFVPAMVGSGEETITAADHVVHVLGLPLLLVISVLAFAMIGRTERRAAEAERLFSQAFEQSVVPSYWVDPAGVLVRANLALAGLLQRPREQLLGQTAASLGLPSDPASIGKTQTIARPGTSAVRIRATCNPVQDHAGKQRVLALQLQDVTEQEQALDELQASEERFRTLADDSPMLIRMTATDGSTLYLNRAALHFAGLTISQAVGLAWHQLVHPADLAHWSKSVDDALAGTRRYQVEARFRRNDGAWRSMLETGSPRYLTDGSFAGMVCVLMDVTDADEKLQSARQTLQARSAFLAGMSHEIRSPLSSILGFAQLLADPELSPAERSEFAHTISTSGQHLMAVLDDVLDLSRIEAGRATLNLHAVDPQDVAQDALDIARPLFSSKGLSLHMTTQRVGRSRVQVDEVRLRQVLINLLSNAAKFTSQGGATLELAQSAGRTILRVIDTGIGISPADLESIFDPYRRAAEQHAGTGLGLAISRRYAELMKGTLSVQSAPGSGSTFTLELPTLSPADAASSGDRSAPSTDRPAAPGPRRFDRELHLLVADDVPANQRLLETVLQRAGATVVTVGDGQLVLDRAAADTFDAIVLDIQMPHFDGYATARALRERGNATPILALTANAMPGDRERCLEAGCDDYLSKPVDVDALIRLLQTLTGSAASSAAAAPAKPVSDAVKAVFLKGLPADLNSLRQQLQARDFDEARRVVHQLKGTGGAFGFHNISNLAAHAEQSLLLSQDPAHWHADVDALIREIESVLAGKPGA
jgi:PAS domain S-box-containing protein